MAGAARQRPDGRGGVATRPVLAVATLVVGLLACGGGLLLARDWSSDRSTALTSLRSVEAERAAGSASPALDDRAAEAIEDLDGSGGLLAGALLFGLGAVATGAGVGGILGRVRRRQARVALHPSLVAAADRKLERLLAEHAQDLVTMLDDHGRFTYVSPSVTAILGYDPGDLIGKRFDVYLDAATLDQAGSDRRTGEPLRHRARHAHGEVRWLETLSHRIEDDRAVGVVTLYSSRDVTERVRLEEELVAERRLLGDTLASVHAGVLSVDVDGDVIDANSELRAMLGFQPAPGSPVAAVESRYRMLDADGVELPPDERPLRRAVLGGSVKQLPATVVGADGSRRDVMVTAGPLIGGDGQRNGAVLTMHDVSELRAAEAELRSLATVDPLTGLPNRRHLEAVLEDAMARNHETPDRVALLFLDLDGFKAVNDTYGHDVGDEVLKLVGARIVSCLRGHDVVGRLGGDEFVVVVERLHAPEDVAPLAARIERSLAEPMVLPSLADPDDADSVITVSITTGASIGVASGADATSASELMARADAAMYERKRERAGASSAAARAGDLVNEPG